MSYRYWLHQSIQQDFNEGYEWYEDKKAGLGMEFLTAVEKKIAEIVLHPETYSSKGNPRYREAAIESFPYVVVYRIYKRKKEIFISAVHHVKKSPRKKYRSS